MATSSSNRSVEVSFILPCLNESHTLAQCILRIQDVIKQKGLDAEIVVVDNGSTDGSQEIARGVGVRLVCASPKGYGSAIIQGCRQSNAEFFVIGDSDLSYDFHESIPMVEMLRQGYDLVVGSRFKGTIHPGAMPWKNRYLGNPILTGLLNLFFRSGLSDAHCGLRAVRKEAFCRMQLRCLGMEFASEMIVKASLEQMKISEVPIHYYPDGRQRAPNLRPFQDGWRHLKFLLLYCPLWLYFIPGLAFLIGGFLANTALSLIPENEFIRVQSFFFGTHWMIPATLITLVGLQMIWLGVFSHTYASQKGFYPAPGWMKSLNKFLSVDKGLLVSLLFALVGIGIEARIVMVWFSSSFGELAAFRPAIYGLMWLVLGVEYGTNSFFLDLMINGVDTIPKVEER